jgi:hypothetical protein
MQRGNVAIATKNHRDSPANPCASGSRSFAALEPELGHPVPLSKPSHLFRNRKDAEQAVAEIVEDGGRPGEYRIVDQADGGYLIHVMGEDGETVAGLIGA